MSNLLTCKVILPTREVFYSDFKKRLLLNYAGFNLIDLANVAIGALNNYNGYLINYIRGYCYNAPNITDVVYEELYNTLNAEALEVIDRNPDSELVYAVVEFIAKFQAVINEVLYRTHVDVVYSDKYIRVLDWVGEDVIVDFLPR